MPFRTMIRPHWVNKGRGECMELEMHVCQLTAYEHYYHKNILVELPTGKYAVDGAYIFRDYATVYLRRVSVG